MLAMNSCHLRGAVATESLLRSKSTIDFLVLGSAGQIIQGYIVIIGKLNQVCEWNGLKSSFISGINFLPYAKDFAYGILGEISIFTQIM